MAPSTLSLWTGATCGEIQDAAKPLFGSPRQLCVWAKDNGGMGTFYRSQHELVFVFKKGDAAHINNFELGQHGRYRTNVWDYPGVNTFKGGGYELLALHPTVKPVGLIADAIRDCSHRKGIVLDPFCGSGTILIAAERTGRQARAIELDPRYVDVSLMRWQRVTRPSGDPCGNRTNLGPGSVGTRARERVGDAMAYEIGYRRPPPSGRFKKGRSGNPKGRPKGSRNFLTLLVQELGQSIVVNENGKKKTMTRMQAMVKRIVAGALSGEQKALLTLVEILRRTGQFEETDVGELLPGDYEAILDTYIAQRQLRATKKARTKASREDQP